jgi:hypothetical protein
MRAGGRIIISLVASPPSFAPTARYTDRQLSRGWPPSPPPLTYFAGDGLQTAYTPAPLFSVSLNQFFSFPRVVNTYFFVCNQPYVRSVLP